MNWEDFLKAALHSLGARGKIRAHGHLILTLSSLAGFLGFETDSPAPAGRFPEIHMACNTISESGIWNLQFLSVHSLTTPSIEAICCKNVVAS